MKRRTVGAAAPIRLAIVGCGEVVRSWHLPALERVGLSPTLFVDANVARAKKFASAVPGAEAASDIGDIGDRVDAAIVAVPHSLHRRITEALLGQRIHVLVEKPMALSRSECASMIDAAVAADRVLAVGLTRRQYSVLQWVRSRIAQGDLGDIYQFHIWDGFRFQWPIDSLSFFSRETNGGGVLVDTGAHTLDVAEWFFGPLHVTGYVDDADGGVEADCRIEVRGPASAIGTIDLSRTRDLRNVLSVESSRGGLIVDLYGRSVEGSGGLSDLRGPGRCGFRHKKETAADAFEKQLRAWIAAIEGRGSSCVTGVEAARSVGLIEDCYGVRKPLVFPWETRSGLIDGSKVSEG